VWAGGRDAASWKPGRHLNKCAQTSMGTAHVRHEQRGVKQVGGKRRAWKRGGGPDVGTQREDVRLLQCRSLAEAGGRGGPGRLRLRSAGWVEAGGGDILGGALY